MKKIAITLLFAFEAVLMKAQPQSANYEIGFNAGASVYQGDLSPNRFGSFKTAAPFFNIFLSRILSDRLSLRTNLAFGSLKGNDSKFEIPAYRQQRNFNFKTPIYELSELLVFQLLGNVNHVTSTRFSPYLFAGVGIDKVRIRRDWSRFNSEYFNNEPETIAGLEADMQHSLPNLIVVLPIGVGMRYELSQKLFIHAEASYRHSFSDYFDGFSKAANPSLKDSYQTYSVGIIYCLKREILLKCPVLAY